MKWQGELRGLTPERENKRGNERRRKGVKPRAGHGQTSNEILMSQGDLADSPGFQGAKGEAGAGLILKKSWLVE